jgi:hypothetical protein
MKRLFAYLMAVMFLASIALVIGCDTGASKDMSHENIKPIGTPNPNLPQAGAGGAKGPGGDSK